MTDMRVPRAERSLETIQALRLSGTRSVAIGELTRVVRTQEEPSLYHKNLQAVTYVTGDLAGRNESPVYAILEMNSALARLRLPEGYALEVFNATQPFDTAKYAMKWDGEWHITIEVFRDLGLAFAVVLVLIYVLVVGWFQSFTTPLLIMRQFVQNDRDEKEYGSDDRRGPEDRLAPVGIGRTKVSSQ